VSAKENLSRPHIGFAVASRTNLRNIAKEVLAGLEEEGVPWEIKEAVVDDEVKLAYHCAQTSPLGVGVAIGKDGIVVIHLARLPQDKPLFYLSKDRGCRELWRIFGSNAARVAKGIPFKDVCIVKNNDYSKDDNNNSRDLELFIANVTSEVVKMLKMDSRVVSETNFQQAQHGRSYQKSR